jgi:dTDP-4-dehydrorhamnose reductase
MKVLVLGHNGMLGNTVLKYLSDCYTVHTISHRYPSELFIKHISEFDGGWVVNCIGAVPAKYTDFSINYTLPMFLDSLNKFKIINITTDTIDSDSPYSYSKKILNDWLMDYSKHSLSIRASVIGLGEASTNGIIHWVLSQQTIFAHRHHMWNGITALEWAKHCRKMIDGSITDKHITLVSDCISKYELISMILDVFKHTANLIEHTDTHKNNCIGGIYTNSIYHQLIELRNFLK